MVQGEPQIHDYCRFFRKACFDTPVLCAVEGLSTNGDDPSSKDFSVRPELAEGCSSRPSTTPVRRGTHLEQFIG